MKQEERFEKISELLGLEKMDKGVQLYIKEVFNTDGDISDRKDLLLEKLGVHKVFGLSDKERDNISENFETMLTMYDSGKPIDMQSVDFFKWNSIAEAIKKPSKIYMKDFKWSDSSGTKRVNEAGAKSSYVNQSFWNDDKKRIYLTQENIVEYSNYYGIEKGQELSLNKIQMLKSKGNLVCYTK